MNNYLYFLSKFRDKIKEEDKKQNEENKKEGEDDSVSLFK